MPQSFSLFLNKHCANRYIYALISFFGSVLPPPLWDTRRRVWAIADNAKMLLDIGCGYAHYTRSSKAETIIGIDLDKNALKEGYSFGKYKKFGVVCCDASFLPFKDHVFDTIIATEVLEHVPQDGLAVKEMHRVLQKKGKLFITTPNGEYLPIPYPHHLRHYKEKEIIFLLTPYFKLTKITKRFDKSYLMVSYFTLARDRMLRFLRSMRGLKSFHESRMNYTVLVFFSPFVVILAPIINLTMSIENYLESGKYNLVIEGICK